jgi:hypothetical protein
MSRRNRPVDRRRVARTVGAFVAVVVTFAAGDARPTVSEQRARLPPPAFCEDPVAGTWRSHSYVQEWGEWAIFTLDIRHDPDTPDGLIGTMRNESWFGQSTESEPPPCAGQLHYIVSMNARGSYTGGNIEFHGIDWRLDGVLCGSAMGFEYNLDRFWGAVDPEIQEFQSVNNDSGRYVNVPMVFRRVGCLDQAPPTQITVTPPSFYPEDARSGCGAR